MELNPNEAMDIKDQEDKNQLPLNHDATIHSDLNKTLDDTKDSEMPQIKLEEQEILEIFLKKNFLQKN